MNISRYSRLVLSICTLYVTSTVTAQQNSQKMDSFINTLMSKMTLEEKIGQLNLVTGGEATTGSTVSTGVEGKIKSGAIGGIFSMSTPQRIRAAQDLAVKQSRLGIPLIFGMDVIHGYKTIFPIPIGLASSWDMNLVRQTAQIAATEATADGINWTFSPMVDISRDPRWGRFSEGNGEDPYLSSKIAVEMVKGYQGNDLAANNTLMACVKHFALYGAAEAGRDYNTTDMSLHRMYNEYLPPYKAAIDAGAGSIMTSFNDINGVPATANKWLMTDLLRQQWGFQGMVVTDYTAINELIDHGLGDLQRVSALSLKAGVDMDMVGEGYLGTLKKSLEEGKVSQADIDRACRLVLEAKYKLGLFENPYKYCDVNRAKNNILTKAHLAKSREVAAKSFVLLKNDKQTLPFTKKGKIALVGPLANTGANMPGTWSVSADLEHTPSLLQGMKDVLGNKVAIQYALGTNLLDDPAYQERATMFGRTIPRDNRSEQELIAEAIKASEGADAIVAALGESSEMSGESSSRTEIGIPANQQRLLQALLKTGKPVVLVLFTGRPLTLTWENEHVPAILNVWFGGTETGKAVADVLFGDVNPSGKLPATFPKNVGQIPLYYNAKTTGRPLEQGKWFQKFRSNYLDVDNDPLYPFGYGLSYTAFQYNNLRLSTSKLQKQDKITVTVDVKNTGKYDGEEVVQLYIRDMVGSVTRPVKELKGFQKIAFKAGETKAVEFELTEEDLKFYNEKLEFVAEPGEFEVYVGTNSRDVLTSKFELQN
ncbi:beta-glucosidase BglX [Sphingobacterium spiritivorum]|uniref:beta-glucosidase BglX n=1 Tax=Sphingobacterium spiritivorum TaxID=258 RepID=UPI0006975D08|nr:beta-glucosidase BglX [Sphingobacterium spiritivorum]QQT36116.1 beta-glucosidase BglX [Sphingobacterium spiritivorum]WQD32849.1 beta-glucosidase BglX [Sphingobacterium spiritivorum]SUJ15599.1 Periplasmic beta-glucosidase precursor [Sphingobacterium spiritivorum]